MHIFTFWTTEKPKQASSQFLYVCLSVTLSNKAYFWSIILGKQLHHILLNIFLSFVDVQEGYRQLELAYKFQYLKVWNSPSMLFFWGSNGTLQYPVMEIRRLMNFKPFLKVKLRGRSKHEKWIFELQFWGDGGGGGFV